MIKYTEGNLLDCPCGINTIIHQANTHNTFGAGIARQIREKYPEAYRADTEAYSKEIDPRNNLLGKFSFAEIGRITIINLYGQKLIPNPLLGFNTDYNAVIAAFSKVREFLKNDVGNIVGIPYGMGCGLGGGDWIIYEAIIKSTFIDENYDVYIVEYNP